MPHKRIAEKNNENKRAKRAVNRDNRTGGAWRAVVVEAGEVGVTAAVCSYPHFPSPCLPMAGSRPGRWVVLANPLGRTLAIGFLFAGIAAVATAATSLELREGLVANRTAHFLDGQLASRRHFVEQLATLFGLLRRWMGRRQ